MLDLRTIVLIVRKLFLNFSRTVEKIISSKAGNRVAYRSAGRLKPTCQTADDFSQWGSLNPAAARAGRNPSILFGFDGVGCTVPGNAGRNGGAPGEPRSWGPIKKRRDQWVEMIHPSTCGHLETILVNFELGFNRCHKHGAAILTLEMAREGRNFGFFRCV
jgi:hypothetical protein